MVASIRSPRRPIHLRAGTRLLSNLHCLHQLTLRASASVTNAGLKVPTPEEAINQESKSLFYFDTGYALFAKRPPRPFPPPFFSLPSRSFSDPLSTHNRSRDRRPYVNGEIIRGVTNGDDAVLVGENFVGANDGVGAWATKEKGHAA